MSEITFGYFPSEPLSAFWHTTALQETKKAYRNNLMPRTECVQIGEITVKGFVKVLHFEKANGFLELENTITIEK